MPIVVNVDVDTDISAMSVVRNTTVVRRSSTTASRNDDRHYG